MDPSKPEHSSFTTIYPTEKVDATPLMPASVDVLVETSGAVAVPVPVPASVEVIAETSGEGSVSVPVPAPPPDTEAIRVIRGYRLLQKLGSGAFAVVYKALSSGGVEVAIKEIRYPLDQPQSKRELEAMELIKGLRHPYLLSVHDFWTENDRLYIAMELADCTLLELAAQRGPGGIPQPELLRIFEEAAELLDFLHEKCVLHRDIKPANLLLLRGHTKVADLGLAKITTGNVAYSMTVAGTPVYMAPETFGNEFRPESDQYALALCYAEMRLGRRICEANNMASVVTWHLQETPKLDGLQPHEEKAIRRALSKNVPERFRSCREFVQALHAPPPVPVSAAKSRKPALALGLLFLIVPFLVVLGWRLLLPAPNVITDLSLTKTLVEWTPEEHDFVTPPDAQIVTIGGKRYYDRIVKRVGENDVVFLLIPRLKPDDPRTFYIMENKVCNKLFRVVAEDTKFKELISEWRKRFRTLELGEWPKGGKQKDKLSIGAPDDFPVLRVNVMEAYCFASCIGGRLPTAAQWDAAAGRGKNVKAPYQDPDSPLKRGEVAVNRRDDGPMPVGMASRDISPFGCRDMAGNGAEWTRTMEGGATVPPSQLSGTPLVLIRGRTYYGTYGKTEPYHFDDKEDWVELRLVDEGVSFRVVVEPD